MLRCYKNGLFHIIVALLAWHIISGRNWWNGTLTLTQSAANSLPTGNAVLFP